MVGVYILRHSKNKATMEDIIKKSTFIPMLSLTYEFTMESIPHEGIVIMPSTYEVSYFY